MTSDERAEAAERVGDDLLSPDTVKFSAGLDAATSVEAALEAADDVVQFAGFGSLPAAAPAMNGSRDISYQKVDISYHVYYCVYSYVFLMYSLNTTVFQEYICIQGVFCMYLRRLQWIQCVVFYG